MIVIIDLENTLSNPKHRMEILYKSKLKCISDETKISLKKSFQNEFSNDLVNNNVKKFMDSIYENKYNVIILTAKLESYKEIVKLWLTRHKIKYHKLVMKDNYFQSDIEFKREFAIKNIKEIVFAIDDVGENCKMFTEIGIPSLRIEQK